MPRELKVSIGGHSDRGRKEINQDFHGALIPGEPLLASKGVAIAIADGISSSKVSQIASESAIKSFLTDYYCTSDSWSVKTSAHRVLAAANSWLHAENRRGEYRHDKDRGYVCTLSALVVRSNTAHVFHVGDARVYRVSGAALEQLTNDHRVVVSPDQSYLGRALGVNPQVEIDYRAIQVETGDVFVLATDGAHEYVSPRFVTGAIAGNAGDLDAAARAVVAEALRRGSPDNLTVQIVRIDELPDAAADEVSGQVAELPLPPLLEARMAFDGYTIVRELHASSRSHVYLATDGDAGALVCVKIPSIDLRGDTAYLKRFLMEEWVARRVDSAHVLKPRSSSRKRNYLYVVTEFVDGQTLTQWMIDNPKPGIESVRGVVEQVALGLRAFHRMEMLHRDLRPDNIMIDRAGTVKIIDFGSVRVAGVVEGAPLIEGEEILGAVQYAAPEYFLGETGSSRSDLFSLGVIAHQMLTGKLPYGADVPKARTKARQRKLTCASLLDVDPDIPPWIDWAIRKAVHPDPWKRQEEVSEFVHDLRHPNEAWLNASPTPLIERNPVLFWKGLSFILGCAVLALLTLRFGGRP